ncbi:MAG: hypothetical protein NVSMB18_23630 [Acetobacteraceae bacterium]
MSETETAAGDAGQGRHVLLVVPNQQVRYALADLLLEAGFRLTMASTYRIADLLVEDTAGIDLLVTAQPLADLGDGSVARLAREADPHLPILLLEQDTAAAGDVLGVALGLIQRWPMEVAFGTGL